MIIHSPIVSGSLTFANGATFTLPSGGVYSGSFSGSYQGTTFTGGTFSGNGSALTFGGTGIISGSSQLITDFDARYLNTSGDGIVSSSAQIQNLLPIGTISGSSQVSLASVTGNSTSNVTEGSNLYYTDARVKTKLTAEGVISGSSQVQLGSASGNIVLATQTTGDYVASLVAGTNITLTNNSGENATPTIGLTNNAITIAGTSTALGGSITAATILQGTGVVSGSSQVNADTITNFDSNVLEYNNSLAVVSGSASSVKTFLSLGNVTNESKATMFTSPTFTGTVSGVTATMVGLGNVTNESKATMFTSPDFTGTPTAPTAASNTNSTQIATTAYVQQELTDLIGGAAAAFDTLIEISASLASGDSNLNTLVSGKLTKSSNLSDLTDTSAARTNLGLAIGTNVQAYNSTLAAVAGGTYSGDDSITTIGTVTAGSVTAILPTGTISGSAQVTGLSNAQLTNSTISGIALGSNLGTLTIGTGLSGTSYNGSAGVTIANTGVTSNVAGTGVSVSGATGAVTISIGQSVATSANAQFNSLGIGMAASATAGRIDATNDIVAYSSSDIRFKENITPIENAIDKINQIGGYTYDWKEENKIEHGYDGNDVGVIAQEIEAVLPQLVQTRESGYKAVKYDKLVALLIEGIKEQQFQIDELRNKIEKLENGK